MKCLHERFRRSTRPGNFIRFAQIAVLFIGLLLLSMIVITLINGLFLEHYYISRKTEVLRDAVQKSGKS